MPTPEKPQEPAYDVLFFDLVEPFLPRLPDKIKDSGLPSTEQIEFAEDTKSLLEATNDALISLRDYEQLASRYGTSLSNSNRAKFLVEKFPFFMKLECTAYLIRHYIPMRTWAYEEVGYFLDLALTDRLEDKNHETYKQAKRAQKVLRKRINLPPQQPRSG